MRKLNWLVMCALALACSTPVVAQIAFVDSQGRAWRELTGTTGHSWSSVTTRCPTDGSTPCTGSLGSVSLEGWIWASRAQVQAMLAEFDADIAAEGCLYGEGCASAAQTVQWLFGGFPVFDTTVLASGLTSTAATGAGLASYAYAPSIQTDSEFVSASLLCATSVVPKSSVDSSQGIWLFRPVCPGDLDANGTVDGGDISLLLLLFGSGADSLGDLDDSGMVDAGDMSLLLLGFGGCA